MSKDDSNFDFSDGVREPQPNPGTRHPYPPPVVPAAPAPAQRLPYSAESFAKATGAPGVVIVPRANTAYPVIRYWAVTSSNEGCTTEIVPVWTAGE